MRASFRLPIAVAAAAALVAVSVAGAEEDDKVVLTIGITNDFGSFNPLVGRRGAGLRVLGHPVRDSHGQGARRLRDHARSRRGVGGLDDGKTYTYTLREGLKWSDGEPLTAEDVA